MKWSGEQYKCRNPKCGEIYPYRLSTCLSCGSVCDKIADAPQGSSSGLNSDDSVLADILEAAKQKEQEKSENELAQLYSAVNDVCSKNEYAAAIPYLERILEITPDSMNPQNLLDFCKNKVEQQRREEEAKMHAGDGMTVTVNGVEFAFRWCPAGTFMMGSPESEKDRYYDEMQHQVTLTRGFWMMETQVTQKQWKAVMGNNSSNFEGDDLPVVNVSCFDCQDFCKKCTQLGLPVQLPTEAQWEYACRAGTTGAYAGNLDDMAWYDNNCWNTHPVGTKTPNAWGLYDMHGNVWEWCQDWYGDYPSGSVTDPAGPSSGSSRVFRGGSWRSASCDCRSANRHSEPDGRYDYLGFRVVKVQ